MKKKVGLALLIIGIFMMSIVPVQLYKMAPLSAVFKTDIAEVSVEGLPKWADSLLWVGAVVTLVGAGIFISSRT